MNLAVLGFNPCELIDDLVAPFIHAFISNMHLRVKDPEEAETLGGEGFNWDIDDLLIAHGGVL
jgi:hypothetical protein